MENDQKFGTYKVEAPDMMTSTISPHVLLGPELSFKITESEMQSKNMSAEELRQEKEGKYFRRVVNLAHATRIANHVVEPGKSYPGEPIEDVLARAKLEENEDTYRAIEQRFNRIALPMVGLDPENESDTTLFQTAFRDAANTHNALNETTSGYIGLGADQETLGYTEMLQETKSANTPLDLMQLMFDQDSERLRYESTRKFVSAFYGIPSLLERATINGAGKDIMTILKQEGVIQGEQLFPHTIVAKVDGQTGECIEWVDYDPSIHTSLQKQELPDGKLEWKELVFSLPSRRTRDGLAIHFTSRDKLEESLQTKTVRKLEATHPDTLAFRVVLNEQEKDTTEQIQKFYQESIDAFEKNGYSVKISEPHPTKDGKNILNGEDYTNTLAQPFTIRVRETDKSGNIQHVEYHAVEKGNEKNKSTNGKRKVFQTDWTLEKGDRRIVFEMQCVDTKGDVNREVSEWSDAAYKANQLFEPLKHMPDTSFMAFMYPPHYVDGVDVNIYKETIMRSIRNKTLNDPSREILPRKKNVVLYENK